jgi:hypothetical protein
MLAATLNDGDASDDSVHDVIPQQGRGMQEAIVRLAPILGSALLAAKSDRRNHGWIRS